MASIRPRRRRPLGALPLAAAVLALPAATWAELYKWTDASGRTHVSQTLLEVPQAYRDRAVVVGPPSPPASARPVEAPSGAPEPSAERLPLPVPETDGPTDADGNVDRDGHDAAWWQARVRETQQQLAAARAQLADLERERRRQPVIRKERERRAAVTAAREQIEQLERQLAIDLPREARAAGAPSAWLDVPPPAEEGRPSRQERGRQKRNTPPKLEPSAPPAADADDDADRP